MFGSSLLGMEVTIRSVPITLIPARPHPRKKRRIQKKMIKRYGYKSIPQTVDLEEILIDRGARRIYCYTEMAGRLLSMASGKSD